MADELDYTDYGIVVAEETVAQNLRKWERKEGYRGPQPREKQ